MDFEDFKGGRSLVGGIYSAIKVREALNKLVEYHSDLSNNNPDKFLELSNKMTATECTIKIRSAESKIQIKRRLLDVLKDVELDPEAIRKPSVIAGLPRLALWILVNAPTTTALKNLSLRSAGTFKEEYFKLFEGKDLSKIQEPGVSWGVAIEYAALVVRRTVQNETQVNDRLKAFAARLHRVHEYNDAEVPKIANIKPLVDGTLEGLILMFDEYSSTYRIDTLASLYSSVGLILETHGMPAVAGALKISSYYGISLYHVAAGLMDDRFGAVQVCKLHKIMLTYAYAREWAIDAREGRKVFDIALFDTENYSSNDFAEAEILINYVLSSVGIGVAENNIFDHRRAIAREAIKYYSDLCTVKGPSRKRAAAMDEEEDEETQ